MRRKIQALEYEWDLVGNLTSRGETSVCKMLTETFTYDTLNRLTEAQVAGRSAQTVTYDALGNITNKSDVGAYTYGSTRPHAVTRAGSDTYTCDDNGNGDAGAEQPPFCRQNRGRKVSMPCRTPAATCWRKPARVPPALPAPAPPSTRRRLSVWVKECVGPGSTVCLQETGFVWSDLSLTDVDGAGLTDLMYFVSAWHRKSRDNYQWTGDWRYRLSPGSGFTYSRVVFIRRRIRDAHAATTDSDRRLCFQRLRVPLDQFGK